MQRIKMYVWREIMRKKLIALFTAIAVSITAVGCGTKEQVVSNEKSSNTNISTETNMTEERSNESSQKNETVSGGMGRYVETIVYEETNFYNKVEKQTLNDGQMVFLNSLSNQQIVSKDNGSTWSPKAQEAFSNFIDVHYPAESAIAKDGTIAIIGMDKIAGTESDYEYNLYIYNTDDTTKQISVPLPDTNSHLRELAFDEQGTLYVFASGCKTIYQVDISTKTAEKLVTLEDSVHLLECRDGILMCLTFEKIFLYDLEKKSFIEDEVLDSFVEQNYEEISWTGGGYTAYAFLGTDKTIYIAGEKGLHRHVIDGGIVEQVIDGSLSSLGDPTYSILAMTMNDKNEFFAAYNDGKIVKFTYDATVPSVPSDKITVYSLSEDDLVKQTISAYQTQNPDMFVEYQIGIDEGGVTREDALKKLNTQLLSGNGPDVIMLDGMNIDTYAEKGVLMDLSDIVNDVNQSDGLYMNLMEQFQTNANLYAVPAKFYIPVILGDSDYVDHVEDYQSIADMTEKARDAYPDTSILSVCSATGIMRRFMPVCAPTWKDENGQLNQSKIREFLEQSKRLYDVEMNGTPEEYIEQYKQKLIDADGRNFEEEKYFMMLLDTSYLMQQSPFAYGEIIDAGTYRTMLSVPRISGLENTLIKLMSGQCNNVYHPESIVGINAATKNVDAAGQFVRMMLSTTVQETLQFGIPVNKKALPKQFAYDESELGEDGGQYYMSFSMKDGIRFSYTIYPVDQEGINKLESWIAQFDTPYLRDIVLETAVYTEGAKYIEGIQDIDSAVKAIANSVEIYLSE